MASSLEIRTIEVRNFRAFESYSLELGERFTLLVGDNGTGKTALLDALAIGAGSFFLGLDDTESRAIHPSEVRVRTFTHGQTVTVEQQYPCEVKCHGITGGQEIQWARSLVNKKGRTTHADSESIRAIGERLAADVAGGEISALPLISYYGTGRLWVQLRKREMETQAPGSRLDGYANCLDPASDQKRLLSWIKTNELAAIQKKEPIGVLEAVRAAIIRCLGGEVRNVFFDVSHDDLMLEFPGRSMPFRLLSDGYRNTVAMVADIAFRAATLNPQLGREAPQRVSGVVLIDELDLHLHPKWQRRVVADLTETFPHLQFVATTHSPFIIQSLAPARDVRLVNLDNHPFSKAVRVNPANASIEDIAEDIQGVELPSRSRRYLEMMEAAKEYYRVLGRVEKADKSELAKLKTRLDELSMPFSDDPAYQAFLQMQRAASGISSGGR